jgi:hypothetical protein
MAVNLARALWRKATRSGGNGNCVEAAFNLNGIVAVRDSKDPAGPAIVVKPAAWSTFAEGVKAGRFTG